MVYYRYIITGLHVNFPRIIALSVILRHTVKTSVGQNRGQARSAEYRVAAFLRLHNQFPLFAMN